MTSSYLRERGEREISVKWVPKLVNLLIFTFHTVWLKVREMGPYNSAFWILNWVHKFGIHNIVSIIYTTI